VVVLNSFAKYKSHGLDDWSVELFMHFMDLMVLDILLSTKESQTSSYISSALNFNYISLISKVSNESSFKDY